MNLKELIEYFKTIPEGPVQLDECTRIVNMSLFVNSSISILQAHPGNKVYLPYYERLLKLYQKCENTLPGNR